LVAGNVTYMMEESCSNVVQVAKQSEQTAFLFVIPDLRIITDIINHASCTLVTSSLLFVVKKLKTVSIGILIKTCGTLNNKYRMGVEKCVYFEHIVPINSY